MIYKAETALKRTVSLFKDILHNKVQDNYYLTPLLLAYSGKIKEELLIDCYQDVKRFSTSSLQSVCC